MSRLYPDRPFVGVGIVVFRGNQVLLAERGKPPISQRWSIPGGAQEIGETLHEAAHRELKEETNLTADIIGLVDVVDAINRDDDGRVRLHYTLVDFAAEWTGGDAVAGDDVAAVKWVPYSDIESCGLWDKTLRVIQRAHAMREH